MDVKEAITQLTGLKKYCEGMAECDESGSYVFDLDVQALDMAITALSPPNEWVNRVRELDELYTKLQIITGFTVEQLLEMFAAGYTLEKPDYSKSFEEMASLAETTPPNEPLTLEEPREMDEPVWVACKPIEGGNGYWCLCQHGHIITPAGSIYDVKEIPHWVFYRRPLEGEV